jgi:diadenylate cyclase
MLPNQMFNAVLSSLRTFDPLSDTLDILIISFVFYQLLQFARKSRAGQLVKGIILILVFYGLAVMLNLKTVTWVLNNVITIGFMAAVVIFQPELRRTLERMGQSTMWANLLVGNRRSDPSLRGAWQSAVVAICDAAEQLSDTRTGALMVLTPGVALTMGVRDILNGDYLSGSIRLLDALLIAGSIAGGVVLGWIMARGLGVA